jgi:Tol biopolymer transport system component
MKRINIFLLFLISLILITCGENENEGIAPPYPVTESPYDDPVWHPSGWIIGFNHTPIREIYQNKGRQFYWKSDRDSMGFWLINADGTNMRRILPYYLNTPAWSPDGKWIAFSNNAQINIMPFDGEKFDTTAIQVLTDIGNNFFPSWSPDGEWIAYDSNANSPKGQYFIWKMKNDGTSKKTISYTPNLGETRMPFWKKDFSIIHQRYVGVGSPEIFGMDSTGYNEIRITDNKIHETFPKSSPDNKYITYISYSGGLTLNKIDVSTNKTLNLTNCCVNYSWSPNGEKIVYVNFYYSHIYETTGSLWIMDADGGNKQPLTYNSFQIVKQSSINF